MDLSHPEAWCARAVELGADVATTIDPNKIVTAEWVRMKCLYGCDDNGSYRTCPPHSPEAVDQAAGGGGLRRMGRAGAVTAVVVAAVQALHAHPLGGHDLAGVDDGRGVGAELDGAGAPRLGMTQVHRAAAGAGQAF